LSLSPVVLDTSNPYAWAIMPVVLERVKKFTAEHSDGVNDALPQILAAGFGTKHPSILIIAILQDDKANLDEALAGYIVAGEESYLGRKTGMIYQFEKRGGEDADWVELNKSLGAMVDLWARSNGLDEIMAMAETDSRARLFHMFGYQRGPVLLRRKFNG
jgi:hypothetical protein